MSIVWNSAKREIVIKKQRSRVWGGGGGLVISRDQISCFLNPEGKGKKRKKKKES